jgi:hydroxyacylglutathione hydrolase
MLTVKHFSFNPVQENTYILYNEEKLGCVVDPGCYYDEEKRELQNFIKDNELTIKFLLNTHCHLDHVFGNKFIYETYHTSLHIHPNETTILEFAPASGERWNLPFENYKGELLFLREDDSVKLGNDELKVLHTPGHSPGSISFYSKDQQFILSGDVLFRRSIGRTDIPGSDFKTLIQTITEKLFLLPDNVVVYSGHGEPTSIGDEKKYNPFLNHRM